MPAPARPPSDRTSRLALVLAGTLWSLGGAFIKGLPVGPAGITFYRSAFAALALTPFLRGRRFPRWRDVVVASLIYAALLSLYIAATKGTTAANAIFLQDTAPMYAILLGPYVSGERRRRVDLITLAIAMSGIAILFLGSYHGGEKLPLLMGLGSGALFGLFQLWLKRMRDADPIAVTFCNNAGVALLALPVLLTVAPREFGLMGSALVGSAAAVRTLGWLALMGTVQIALPYVLFSYGLRRVSTGEASLLALIEPVLNPVWVALLIRELPSGPTLAGGALILEALTLRYVLPSGIVTGERGDQSAAPDRSAGPRGWRRSRPPPRS